MKELPPMPRPLPTEYLTDRAYPAFFHPEQAPSWHAAVLAALGRAAPRAGSGWCEIGCGQGFGATLLAAANPAMHFIGIDINPAHIAMARDRAAAAGLQNIEFQCADIRTPGAVSGTFGHIVTHGVMSWVNDEVRRAIAVFIARHLAPDGISAVHYMSEPGGSAFRAFHAVFRSVANRPDPVAEGLTLLNAMRKAKAAFFQLYPHAGQTLDSLLAENPAYVAHEYLNPEFQPLAFRDVQAPLAAGGLTWLGSATPIENIDAISLPSEAAKVIGPLQDVTLRETMKDIARNQALRYDIFAHLAPPPSDAVHLALLRQVAWGLLPGAPAAGTGNLSFQTRIGPVEGDARIFRPMLERLAKGPARFDALEALLPFADRPGLLNQTLQMALWAGIAHPVQPVTDTGPAARLNRLLLAQALDGEHIPALAAPVLGSAITLTKDAVGDLARGGGSAPLRAMLALDH